MKIIDSMKGNKGQWGSVVFAAIISAAGTFTASYLTFVSQSDANSLARLDQAEKTISQLQKDYFDYRQALTLENNVLRIESDKIRKANILLNLELLDLKIKLKKEYNRKELLQSFLDSLPFPAWIKTKREEDGLFVMSMINDQYVMKYNIAKSKYEGATDYDLHPIDIAAAFEKADNEVLLQSNTVTTKEYVMIDGVKTPIVVWKFIVRDDQEVVGIGGVSLDASHSATLMSELKQ